MVILQNRFNEKLQYCSDGQYRIPNNLIYDIIKPKEKSDEFKLIGNKATGQKMSLNKKNILLFNQILNGNYSKLTCKEQKEITLQRLHQKIKITSKKSTFFDCLCWLTLTLNR